MNRPSVSVVIAAYAGGQFIRTTLDSVFRQTRLPEEVVVVDDYSPDDTVAVVEEVANAAPVPLRVIRLEKNSGGPARPLNVGIEAARGDLIVLLDHDDRMTPNRIADQVAAYSSCPDVGVVAGRLLGGGQNTNRDALTQRGWEALVSLPAAEVAPGTFRVRAQDAAAGCLRHGCYVLSCSALLIPKAVWAKVGGFDEGIRTACDYDLLQAVTREHDLAYTTSFVGEWTSPPSTLYSSAGRAQLFADNWQVLNRFAKRGMPRELRPLWRQTARAFLFDHGYAFRNAGEFGKAADCQWRSLCATGLSGRMLKEVVKIVFDCLKSACYGGAK